MAVPVLKHYLSLSPLSDLYVSRSVVPGPGYEWALSAEDPQAQSNYTLTRGSIPDFPFKVCRLTLQLPNQGHINSILTQLLCTVRML